MAMAILLDEFEGNPKELYDLIHDEVQKREIPGVKFTQRSEHRSKGWFRADETAPALGVGDNTHLVLVFAYQFGRSFHVSSRAYWERLDMAVKQSCCANHDDPRAV